MGKTKNLETHKWDTSKYTKLSGGIRLTKRSTSIKEKIKAAIILAGSRATIVGVIGLFNNNEKYSVALREMVISGEVSISPRWTLSVN
jgi:hypothetical protein